MPLETGTFVDDLVATNPNGATDQKSEGDNHLRLIKSVLKATFPNADRAFYFSDVPAAVTGAHTVVASEDNALIRGDVSGGTFAVTLPLGSNVFTGFTVFVMKSDSSSTSLTVEGNGSETINGTANRTLSKQFQCEGYRWDGAEWKVISATVSLGTSSGDVPQLTSLGILPAGIGGADIGDTKTTLRSTEPPGWLFLDADTIGDVGSGADHENANYEILFDIVKLLPPNAGTEDFGAGDTVTLPDARGRVLAGKDNLGGTTANRLTNGSLAGVRHTLGGAGGDDAVALTEAQLASHDHTYGVRYRNDYDATGGIAGALFRTGHGANSATQSTNNAGSGQAHDNMQPTLLVNWIVFAGA